MNAKSELAKAIVAQVKSLTAPMDLASDVVQEYFDSGITFQDDDLAELGLTAWQLTACITLLQNLAGFFAGEAVTTAQYRVTVNAVRRL